MIKYLRPLLLLLFMNSVSLQAALENLFINEYLASNSAVIADSYGEYDDWIELYNAGTEAVDIGGFYISDDPTDPIKWQIPANRPEQTLIPAGAFLLLWCDGQPQQGALHLDFKLSADGESVSLIQISGGRLQIVDSRSFGPQSTDISEGRLPDGSGDWTEFSRPSPGLSNSLGTVQLSPPIPSLASGFYSKEQYLAITAADPRDTVRYTLDASVPDRSSPVYVAALPIRSRVGEPNVLGLIPANYVNAGPSAQIIPQQEYFKSTVVRIRSFRSGGASETVTRNFFIDPGPQPRYPAMLVCVNSSYENLFSDSIGIYVPGDSYIPGDFWTGNYFQRGDAWERRAHVEFFDETGEPVLSQDAGIRIHGGATRVEPQKSLRLYSDTRFEYPFFPEKELSSFRRLLLRNSGNDRIQTLFRDILMTRLARDMNAGLEYQAGRPAVLFLNGEYWGIHNIRERIDKYFLADNFGADPDRLDHLEIHGYVQEGSADNYWQWFSFLENADMQSEDAYRQMRSWIDTDNFRDYNIAQIFSANVDWPANNRDYWRPGGGRWRWVIFDTDFGFGYTDYSHYDRNTLVFATTADAPSSPPSWSSNTPWSNVQLRKMLQNPDFRQDFINRFADMLNTAFATEHVLHRIDELTALYSPLISDHIDRWNRPEGVGQWYGHLARLREFAKYRPVYMRLHILRYFNEEEPLAEDLTGIYELRLSTEGRGQVRVNSILPDIEEDGIWSGMYFSGNPVTVTAIPAEGQIFSGWLADPPLPADSLTQLSLRIDPDGTQQLTAVFEDAAVKLADAGLPETFSLHPPFPNPFNNQVKLRLDLPEPSFLSIRIYSVRGELVRTLTDNRSFSAGSHWLQWDGRSEASTAAPSGIYFLHVHSEAGALTERLLLLK